MGVFQVVLHHQQASFIVFASVSHDGVSQRSSLSGSFSRYHTTFRAGVISFASRRYGEATTFQSHDKKNVITVSRVFTSSLQRKEYRHIEWPGGLSSAVCLGLVGGAFSLFLQPRCSDLWVVRVLQHGRNIFFGEVWSAKTLWFCWLRNFSGEGNWGRVELVVFFSVSYCCLLWLFFGLLSCTIGVGGLGWHSAGELFTH